MRLEVPEVLRREHRALHLQLQSATVLSTPLGIAARRLAVVLQTHLLHEEQFALPLLSALPHLVEGKMGREMAIMLPIADRLRAELRQLRQEHVMLIGALDAFAEAARQEGRAEYSDLAHELIEHTRVEEAILYPAALLAGEYVRLWLQQSAEAVPTRP